MKMVSVNETTLGELLEMLERDPAEEIFLTNSGKAKFKLTRVEEIPRDKLFGAGKDILNLPPDFDEVFVSLDKEMWQDIANSYEVGK